MKERIRKSVVWMLCFLADLNLILGCIMLFLMVYALDGLVKNGVVWFCLFLWFMFVRGVFYKGMYSFRFRKTLYEDMFL